MKFLAACFCLFATVLPCAADEDSKAAKIEELLVVMKADKLVDQIFDQMNSVLMGQLGGAGDGKSIMSEVQPQLMAAIRRRMSWDKMKPQYVRIYGESFTEEEVSAMVAFYKTPAGRSMLEKLPVVMQKSMEIVQPIMKDLTPEIQRIVETAAEKAKQKP